MTINNLLPGKIGTERLSSVVKKQAEAAGVDAEAERQRQQAEIPAGRFGTSDEFAFACAMLCASRAGYTTGRNFLLDGGLHPATF